MSLTTTWGAPGSRARNAFHSARLFCGAGSSSTTRWGAPRRPWPTAPSTWKRRPALAPETTSKAIESSTKTAGQPRPGSPPATTSAKQSTQLAASWPSDSERRRPGRGWPASGRPASRRTACAAER
jgi:hypothetical protein